MNRRLILGISLPILLAGWGCAMIIDLGDEAQLRNDDAGVDTGASDVGVDAGPESDADAGVVLLCGLDKSPNEKCAACIEKSCCEQSKACALDPVCAEGLECIKDCMLQLGCIGRCLSTNEGLTKVTNCSQQFCGADICTPGPPCEVLGSCAITFNDAGQDLIIRNQARSLILLGDDTKCAAQFNQMNKYSDASVCQSGNPQPAPDE